MSLTRSFPLGPDAQPPVAVMARQMGSIIVIEFDKPLVNQSIRPDNWVTDLGGAVTAVVSDVQQVTITLPDDIEPTSVSYLASPPDVIGQPPHALPVEPFTRALE